MFLNEWFASRGQMLSFGGTRPVLFAHMASDVFQLATTDFVIANYLYVGMVRDGADFVHNVSVNPYANFQHLSHGPPPQGRGLSGRGKK
jgi:hypothetical protein